jgi:hypothetical protein
MEEDDRDRILTQRLMDEFRGHTSLGKKAYHKVLNAIDAVMAWDKAGEINLADDNIFKHEVEGILAQFASQVTAFDYPAKRSHRRDSSKGDLGKS